MSQVKPKVAKKPLASHQKDVMIEKNKDDKWIVRTTGSAKALKVFATQSEAAAFGRELARKNGTEIRVKSATGKVREKSSYRK